MVDVTLLSADFESDADGFTYDDDVFGTNRPIYADGERTTSGGFGGGGALRVELGGINNVNVTDGMSGGWERSFTVSNEAAGTLTFRYNMSHLVKYDADEFSELRVAVDGVELPVVAHLDGGVYQATTGWQTVEIDLGTLSAGQHSLTIGGFNNKKTKSTEETEILIDDVELTVAGDPGNPDNTPPVLQGPTTFNIAEAASVASPNGVVADPGSENGDVVATITASDADIPADSLTYSIVGGTGATAFAINSLSGEVTVADASQLDFETTPSLTIDVKVDDGQGGTDTQTYTVGLNDINDGPVLQAAGPFAIDEHVGANGAQNGDSVGSVVALDQDQPADALTYSIDGGSGAGIFAIDASTGEITVADASQLDFETTPSYTLDVQVDEPGGHDFRTYTINLNNLPDTPGSPGNGETTLLQADFDSDTDGFAYVDDAFGTNRPTYADGARDPNGGFSGGALRVQVGGVNNLNVADGMSGAWQRSFTVSEEAEGTLTFRYNMSHLAKYDANEFTEVRVAIDGVELPVVDHLDGGVWQAMTVWQTVEIDLGLLGAGDHTLAIGGFNNKKTKNTEAGEILIDDVEVTVAGGSSPTLPVLELSSLDGTNGFVIAGIDEDDESGRSVSGAGDVNGDGFADLIIGAQFANGGPGNALDRAGESYVIFGRASGFGSVVEAASLDGTNGFIIAGIDEGDEAGHSVSGAGDVNGDGYADLIIGANRADGGPDNSRADAGESYVLFGQASGFGSVVELSSLDGTNGFVITGRAENDLSGFSVSGAGDVNGDGYADLIIGASEADGGPATVEDAGESYVVFGQASGFGSEINLTSLIGNNGFIIAGIDEDDHSGWSVSGAGDLNDDGIDDLVVGAAYGDGGPGNPAENAGESYVIFGRTSGFGSLLELSSLDGTNGFLLAGFDPGGYAGGSVSGAGDVNGDGLADLIVGASDALDEAGESYVVFGRTSGFGSVVELSSLDGTNGFHVPGIEENDFAGWSVSGAGDVNGDGLDDLIVGAAGGGGGPGNPVHYAGESYVIYGRASGFGSELDLGALNGDQGFLIAGIDGSDYSGFPVSGAGDVNGDGFADLIIGAYQGDGGPDNTPNDAGEAYVIFGGDFTGAVDQIANAGGDSLIGNAGADVLFGAQGGDLLRGNGGADVLYGGAGNDFLAIDDAAFLRLDGGSGHDTLLLEGSGIDLDLTAISDLRVQGIEAVDMRGSGDHSLTLDLSEVLNISDTSNELIVFGDAADSVTLEGSWSSQGISDGFEAYTLGAATVHVDEDITLVIGAAA